MQNAKGGDVGAFDKDNKFQMLDAESSSCASSQNSAALDAISENSFFDDNREFQGIIIDKIRDVKYIISMVMDRIQSNALVLYNM